MNNIGADQTAWMRRLICAFVVRILLKQVFSWRGSNCCYVTSRHFNIINQIWNAFWLLWCPYFFLLANCSNVSWCSLASIKWAASWQNHQNDCVPSEDSDRCPVWSESSLSTWRKLGSLATHWAHSEDSDQTGRMPRLIWVFTGRTFILLVLSWSGSNLFDCVIYKWNRCSVSHVYIGAVS